MQFRRAFKRAVVFCSLLLTTLIVAGWTRSYFVADRVQRAGGEVHEPVAMAATPADPFAADWRYIHRTCNARHDCGMFYLYLAEYTSYRGTRDELLDWESQRGWSYQAGDAGLTKMQKQPTHFTTILDWSVLGMGTKPFNAQGEDGHAFALPYAVLMVLFSWPAALWGLHLWKVNRRKRTGRCLACGYDLHGAKSVCPECGAAPTERVAAPSAD